MAVAAAISTKRHSPALVTDDEASSATAAITSVPQRAGVAACPVGLAGWLDAYMDARSTSAHKQILYTTYGDPLRSSCEIRHRDVFRWSVVWWHRFERAVFLCDTRDCRRVTVAPGYGAELYVLVPENVIYL